MAYKKHNSTGFTIVELLVVIVVIGILAAITFVAYTGIQQRASSAVITSDINGAITALEIYKAENGNYPTDISLSTAKASSNVILQSAASVAGSFCVNAYSKTDPTLRMSWDSTKSGLQVGLCNSATIGSSIGGAVSTAARGVNLMPDFTRWTLSGGAVYNSSTKELTLGVNGQATSPLIRIDKPVSMLIGGDFYASITSSYSTLTPDGGWHNGSMYFANDGVTAVLNTEGTNSNGCAQKVTLNTWNTNKQCGYQGGTLVVYLRIVLYGSSGGYSSPDLKIKNPTVIVTD